LTAGGVGGGGADSRRPARSRAGPIVPEGGSASVAEPTDEQLLEAYRGGDVQAFRRLIERHHDDLMRFLVRLMGDRPSAEDVFQEAFLQVHLSVDSFDTSRRFKPWLFTIAANKGRDMLRKRSRRQTMDLSAPISGGSGGDGAGPSFVDLMEIDVPSPEAPMDEQERNELVQKAISELPWALREILLLAYFQRLSYAQVAEELGIPLGTVKSRLHAAVAAFARQWKAMNTSGGSREQG
jgi:RNA polymerase sigma-70 factor, ECF subfamily